jgi:hypothetical protein
MAHQVYLTDGSYDWSGGVDSNKARTIESQLTPNGLKRNQLAWMTNATVRGGGIKQRTAWVPNGIAHDGSAFYQGGFMYEPADGSEPYLVYGVGGRIYRYVFDTAQVTDLSAIFGEVHPAEADQFFFVQAEEFLVIQAGDGKTLPLFWDGQVLRRSVGILGPDHTPSAYPLDQKPYNEIPAATAMDYYQGRIWYAQGRTYGAGDIVGSSASGTLPYRFRDSVLKVTENPLCIGGDNFTVPNNAGNIRAIKHTANINADLGVSELYISTRKAIYSLDVPITRDDWVAANANKQPRQRVVQLNNGWVNDRSVVAVNGDLFGQSLEPSIRSLRTAIRMFDQWGNVPISSNMERALAFNDRSLMRFASGIEFNNRLWQAILPRHTPQGVVHDAIAILDFDIISSFEHQLPPAWEGIYEGQQVLQLFTGDFSGRDRAFAVIVSQTDSRIAVWELTTDKRFENEDSRVIWSFETPAFTFGKEFELKQLMGGELWISKVFGTVEFHVYYRPDSDPCWRTWFYHRICVARSCEEDGLFPECPYPYPEKTYREGYKWPITLPKPKASCDSMGVRPTDIAYQFQVRVVIKGWCQVTGLLVYASPVDKSLYQGLNCG